MLLHQIGLTETKRAKIGLKWGLKKVFCQKKSGGFGGILLCRTTFTEKICQLLFKLRDSLISPRAPKLTTCALNRVWTVRQTAFFELCGVSWTPLDSFKRRRITSSRSDFYSISASHCTLRPLAPFLPCSDICCNRRN